MGEDVGDGIELGVGDPQLTQVDAAGDERGEQPRIVEQTRVLGQDRDRLPVRPAVPNPIPGRHPPQIGGADRASVPEKRVEATTRSTTRSLD